MKHIDGKKYSWCNRCKFWTSGKGEHSTDTHRPRKVVVDGPKRPMEPKVNVSENRVNMACMDDDSIDISGPGLKMMGFLRVMSSNNVVIPPYEVKIEIRDVCYHDSYDNFPMII